MRRINRVLLVNSPIDNKEERKQAVNDRSFPPLGLLAIGTRLKRRFPDIELRIADGDLMEEHEIEDAIRSFRPEIVGMSALTPTYGSALRIATFSKEVGVPYIVLGNDHASFFPELILQKRKDISFIIRGDDGDLDFVDLVAALSENADPFVSVGNLYGREGNQIKTSASKSYQLRDKLSCAEDWPDYSLLDSNLYKQYERNYNDRFGFLHGKANVKPFLVNSARGCYKAKNRCLYCSIYDLSYQWGEPKSFWEAIRRYHETHGLNYFFEVCDNFGPLQSYRKALVESVPAWFRDSDVEMMIYTDARVACKDDKIIEDFKRLHVRRVNIGLDSGDPEELSILKGFRNGDLNRKAVEKLTSNGIQIHCSFVLGSLGETYQSLTRTMMLVDELLENENVVAIEVSPLYPLPCSPAWDLFLGVTDYFRNPDDLKERLAVGGLIAKNIEVIWKTTRGYFEGNDLIDLTLASRLWGDHFTFVGYEALAGITLDLNRKIHLRGKVSGGFV